MLRAETGDETEPRSKTGRPASCRATGRARETSAAVAGMRVDDKKTGDWISFGPLSFSSKLAAAGAGWSQPIDFTVQHVGFMFNGGPAGGTIDRIAYGGRADGPDLAALNRLRDEIDAVNRKTVLTPDQQGQAFAALLPQLLSGLSEAKGELTIEGVAVRGVDDQSLVSFTEASLGGSLTRMPGDAEAVRVTLKENGLSLTPKLADPSTVPRRAELDVGLEDIAIAPLRALVEASGKLRADSGGPADRQRAMQTLIGAVSKLTPRWRVYELTVDTADVGIEAKAEAQGSPLNRRRRRPRPMSRCAASLHCRSSSAMPRRRSSCRCWRKSAPPAMLLTVSPRLDFHLVSTLTKWLTINGNDVSAGFAPTHAAPVSRAACAPPCRRWRERMSARCSAPSLPLISTSRKPAFMTGRPPLQSPAFRSARGSTSTASLTARPCASWASRRSRTNHRHRQPRRSHSRPRRERITAVVSELRGCLSAVRRNPAYTTLLPHLRDTWRVDDVEPLRHRLLLGLPHHRRPHAAGRRRRRPRRLHQEPLGERIDHCGRHHARLDVVLALEEFAVGEQHLGHAGHADEADEIGLGQGAPNGAEFAADRQILETEAKPEDLQPVDLQQGWSARPATGYRERGPARGLGLARLGRAAARFPPPERAVSSVALKPAST